MASAPSTSLSLPVPPIKPTLMQTTQFLVHRMAAGGLWSDRTITHPHLIPTNAPIVVPIREEESLTLANQALDALIDEMVDDATAQFHLELASAEVIRKTFKTLGFKSEMGRKLGGPLIRSLVSSEVLQMLPDTVRLPSPQQGQILATVFLAYVASRLAVGTFDPWLSDILEQLVRGAAHLHTIPNFVVGSQPNDIPPLDTYSQLPVEVTEHVAQLSDLREAVYPHDLSAPHTITSLSAPPVFLDPASGVSTAATPVIIFHPLAIASMAQTSPTSPE